eukprot:926770_1
MEKRERSEMDIMGTGELFPKRRKIACDITSASNCIAKRKVMFSGQADVVLFQFGSPPLHHTRPRTMHRSPAPSGRRRRLATPFRPGFRANMVRLDTVARGSGDASAHNLNNNHLGVASKGMCSAENCDQSKNEGVSPGVPKTNGSFATNRPAGGHSNGVTNVSNGISSKYVSESSSCCDGSKSVSKINSCGVSDGSVNISSSNGCTSVSTNGVSNWAENATKKCTGFQNGGVSSTVSFVQSTNFGSENGQIEKSANHVVPESPQAGQCDSVPLNQIRNVTDCSDVTSVDSIPMDDSNLGSTISGVDPVVTPLVITCKEPGNSSESNSIKPTGLNSSLKSTSSSGSTSNQQHACHQPDLSPNTSAQKSQSCSIDRPQNSKTTTDDTTVNSPDPRKTPKDASGSHHNTVLFPAPNKTPTDCQSTSFSETPIMSTTSTHPKALAPQTPVRTCRKLEFQSDSKRPIIIEKQQSPASNSANTTISSASHSPRDSTTGGNSPSSVSSNTAVKFTESTTSTNFKPAETNSIGFTPLFGNLTGVNNPGRTSSPLMSSRRSPGFRSSPAGGGVLSPVCLNSPALSTCSSQSAASPHRVTSVADIAFENAQTEFEPLTAEQARDRLKFLISTEMKNTRLELEKRGVRIFTDEELEKFVGKELIGPKTLISVDDLKNLRSLLKGEIIEHLSPFYTMESLLQLSKDSLVDLLENKGLKDIAECKRMCRISIAKELALRNLPKTGNYTQMVGRLRVALRAEKAQHRRDEAALAKALADLERKHDRRAVEMMLAQRQREIWIRQLEAHKLCTDAPLYASRLSMSRLYAFRLELVKAVRERARLKMAEVQPQHMSCKELLREMDKRRIAVPSQAMQHAHTRDQVWRERVSRLSLAVVEDIDKSPERFEFGASYWGSLDVVTMSQDQLEKELHRTGMPAARIHALTYRERVGALSVRLRRRHEELVLATLSSEVDGAEGRAQTDINDSQKESKPPAGYEKLTPKSIFSNSTRTHVHSSNGSQKSRKSRTKARNDMLLVIEKALFRRSPEFREWLRPAGKAAGAANPKRNSCAIA